MKKEDFCDVMGEIREDFILEAREKVKVRHWRRWGVLAACLCLVAVLASVRWQPSTTNTEAVAYGFAMDAVPGATYFPLTWEEKQKYKLPKAPTEDDLGEPMGAVTSCEDETLIGSSVYHAAAYPTLDSLCIVASPRGYAYYLCEALSVSAEEGESMNVLLEAYGLPIPWLPRKCNTRSSVGFYAPAHPGGSPKNRHDVRHSLHRRQPGQGGRGAPLCRRLVRGLWK